MISSQYPLTVINMGNFMKRISHFQIHCVVQQVKWILLAVFNWRHRYANCWFSWGLLSFINNLPANRNCVRSEHLPFKSFQLKRTFCLCLQNFNLKMTQSRFSKRWHEWSCSGVTLTWVKDKALQTFSSKILSPRYSGTGFILSASLLWNWQFVAAFLSNWIILCNKCELQFLDNCNSEQTLSYFDTKSFVSKFFSEIWKFWWHIR